MAFSPPVVGCLIKRGLRKGGGLMGTPGPRPGYALGCLPFKERSPAGSYVQLC